MDLYGIGFSVIRLPNERNSLIYIYDPRVNRFPEEVFLHEFLHTLERNMIEHGYTIPDLHDNEKHGYSVERLIGLKNWYRDYMIQNIWDESTGQYIGLYPVVYRLRPVHASEFANVREIPFVSGANIIQNIRGIIDRTIGVFR